MAAKTSDWRPGPTVCRCCFADGCYKDISTEYFWMGKREVYSEMLSDTFDVSIAYAQTSGPNSNSRLICEPCISRLRDASDFKRQVQECEKVFLQHLAEPGSSMEYEILPETSQKEEVKLERVKIEAKLDDDDDDFDDQLGFDDDDDDDMDDEPLTKFASKIPKAESDDLINILQLGDDTKKPEKRKSSTKVKLTTVKKAKKKESPKPSASKAASKPVVEKKKKGEKDDESPSSKAVSRRQRMQNVEILLKFSTAYPFKLQGASTIVCVYCLDEFTMPDEFRKHMDNEHKNPKVSIAVNHTRSMDYVKVDCTNLRCRVCQSVFRTMDEIANHLHGTHRVTTLNMDIPLAIYPHKLEMDNWYCFLCEKKFPTIYNVVKHTPTHFAKNVCEVCGKYYAVRRSLTYHIKVAHGSHFKCNRCWKPFATKAEKTAHLKTSVQCRNFACTLCGERFLSNNHKEKHKAEVHGEAMATYRCPDCPKSFTRYSFYRHYKKEHSKDEHSCNFCGKSFESKCSLKYHINSHTLDEIFKCKVCDKHFTDRRHLMWHMRCHNKVKKVKIDPCEVCGETFRRTRDRERHIKKQHPDIGRLYEFSLPMSDDEDKAT